MHVYIVEAQGVLNGPVTLPVIPGIGLQLPGNAVELDAMLPAPADGHVWALVDGRPTQLADNRGLYYSTEDGQPVRVEVLGSLPPGLTAEPRPSDFHEWGGEGWLMNAAAQAQAAAVSVKQERDAALRLAATRIAPLQDAVDLGVATDAEVDQLRHWKAYRVQLSRIEQQAGFPLEVDWPDAPSA